jgi:hypothetical protein
MVKGRLGESSTSIAGSLNHADQHRRADQLGRDGYVDEVVHPDDAGRVGRAHDHTHDHDHPHTDETK